ncbi:hypothetical protein CERSUDRAFT_89905 [Gelatoporia subvermispora B]|uniref:G domain-containing protein n=1 Tax=Ceriporiopsis subvermispora (strain B) TaxID=914234 RepID=M2RSB8_CERS8|nr:hypothetical protein CERSUDRAFT_89905 [Gelatoporia subvermispora B]
MVQGTGDRQMRANGVHNMLDVSTKPPSDVNSPSQVVPIEQPAAIISVLGEEMSGKSSFVKFLNNDPWICIPTDHTMAINIGPSTPFRVNSRTVVLVDSRGVGGRYPIITKRFVELVFRAIGISEEEGGQREGVIWIHSINDSDNDFKAPDLELLSELCGTCKSPPDLRKVVIVTTHWDAVPEDKAKTREAQLRSGCFKEMIEAGARMERHYNTPESAMGIISRFLGRDIEPHRVD